jgi:hypothetical protein
LAAIQTADYKDKGAFFSPFLLKFAAPSQFPLVYYTNRGDNHCAMHQYQLPSVATKKSLTPVLNAFLPLGDFAVTNDVNFNVVSKIMLIAPTAADPSAVAYPTGFSWICDDHGSGNDNNLAYYWPTAPDGYAALGICFGVNGATPSITNYYCVKLEYLVPGGIELYWSDRGANWKSWNGNMSIPVPSASQKNTNDLIIMAPTTMTSDQKATSGYYVLALSKLSLPIPAPSALNFPVYDISHGVGFTLPSILETVVVLPCTAVNDPTQDAMASNYPFGYLASQAYWTCIMVTSAPEGGTYTQSYTMGTSQDSSTGFENTTSITVGAECGVEAGDAGGFSSKISVSYTNEMTVSGSTSSGSSTSVTEQVDLNLPHSNRVLIWQKCADIVLYNNKGVILSTVTYHLNETYMTYETM